MALPVFQTAHTGHLYLHELDMSKITTQFIQSIFSRYSRFYSTCPRAYWTSSASMQSSSNSLLVPPVSRAAIYFPYHLNRFVWDCMTYVMQQHAEDSQPLTPPALIACSEQWDLRVSETGTEPSESYFCACVSLSIIHTCLSGLIVECSLQNQSTMNFMPLMN